MKRTATVTLLNLLLFTAAASRSATAIAQSTTQPPTTTVPDGANLAEASDAPWWLLILFAVGIMILFVMFAMKGSKEKAVARAPSAPNWKDHARQGYASSRWLYDAMGEDLAVWRGSTQFADATGARVAAGSANASTWVQLDDRMSSAIESLYALEAGAPDRRAADMARNTVTALQATRDALDARAEARFSYRSADANAHDPATLMQAREREVRSSRSLVEARNGLALSLTDLSDIT